MARRERGLEKRDSSLMFREITPPHGWKQDSEFHYLRLTLPGFEAKDITIYMDKHGRLVVRGDKQVSEHKYMSFEETFDVPNDANLEDASGMFEDGQIYCVAIPKVKGRQLAIAMPQEHNNPNPKDNKDGSVRPYNNNNNEIPGPGVSRQESAKDYLKYIRGDKSNKKIALFIAILIAVLVLIVVLIVILRHRQYSHNRHGHRPEKIYRLNRSFEPV